jgi:hypothetical protein
MTFVVTNIYKSLSSFPPGLILTILGWRLELANIIKGGGFQKDGQVQDIDVVAM